MARSRRPSRRAPGSRWHPCRCATGWRRCALTPRRCAATRMPASACRRRSSGRCASCATSQRIRILADGDDLVTSGVPREQPRSAWASFDPDILGSATLALRRARRSRRQAHRRDVHPRCAGRPASVRTNPDRGLAAAGSLAGRQQHRGDERDEHRAVRRPRSSARCAARDGASGGRRDRLGTELGLQRRPVVHRPLDATGCRSSVATTPG